jgi:hypothetical protein
MSAVPAFPGPVKMRLTFGLWASFQAIECSRPPDPSMRMFIFRKVKGLPKVIFQSDKKNQANGICD